METNTEARAMQTITVTLKGQHEFLKDALVSACHYYSTSNVNGDMAVLTYISETDDYDAALMEVLDSINVRQLENLGIDVSIQ